MVSKGAECQVTMHRTRVAACVAVGAFVFGVLVGSQSYDAGISFFRLLEFPLWKTHLPVVGEAPWFLKAYLTNLETVLVRLVCGALGLGCQPVVGLCADGMKLGSYWKLASEAGLSPGILAAWSVLPHGLVEYPVAIYTGTVAVNATLDVWDWRRPDRLRVRVRRQAVQCARAALIATPLLCVAAFLEWGGPRDSCQRLLLPALGLQLTRLERRALPARRAQTAAGAVRRCHVGAWLIEVPGEYQLSRQNRTFGDQSSIFRGAHMSGRSILFTDYTTMYGPLNPEVQFLATMRVDAASPDWKMRSEGVTYSGNPLIQHQYVVEQTTGRGRFSKTEVMLRQGERVARLTFICPRGDEDGRVQQLTQILDTVRLSATP